MTSEDVNSEATIKYYRNSLTLADKEVCVRMFKGDKLVKWGAGDGVIYVTNFMETLVIPIANLISLDLQ